MTNRDKIWREDALAIARQYGTTWSVVGIRDLPAADETSALAESLNAQGDLVGSALEGALRLSYRRVAAHHGLAHDNVIEADLVRAFLATAIAELNSRAANMEKLDG